MPTDIYHSPYAITRKGQTDIHECTKEGTQYIRKTTEATETQEVKDEQH